MEEITTDRGGEEDVMYWWLSEFHIIATFKEFELTKRHMIELEIK